MSVRQNMFMWYNKGELQLLQPRATVQLHPELTEIQLSENPPGFVLHVVDKLAITSQETAYSNNQQSFVFGSVLEGPDGAADINVSEAQ